MEGTLRLKKSITSCFGCEFPTGVELTAEIDSKLRVFVEHPVDKNLRVLVDDGNIECSNFFR